MFISKISINNFKCIKGKVDIQFNTPNGNQGSGLNLFVGDNNTGKSTIFEAFDFVKNGTKKEVKELLNKNTNDNNFFVEIVFVGDIESVINTYAQANKKELLNKLIYEENNQTYLRVRRSSDETSKIFIWNKETDNFENPIGIDGVIKVLFELDFIWADTNPEDISKFGATTICGKLLGEICKPFAADELFKSFQTAHKQVFNDKQNGLKSKLSKLADEVKSICNSQFGHIDLEFHFEELTIDKFYSNVKIKINDGVYTDMQEKGGGLQRAVALAMLQVYANTIKCNSKAITKKPFFLFIDEPEICLHPQAQFSLIESLINLTCEGQVFINTHSPYIVKKAMTNNQNKLLITKKENDTITIQEAGFTNLFGRFSPTWGEVNYFAYNHATHDFHDDLYGYLCKKHKEFFIQSGKDEKDFNQTKFEIELEKFGIVRNINWIDDRKNKNTGLNLQYPVTICTYIRNTIHHPENNLNIAFTESQFFQSIQEMLKLI